MQFLVFVEIQCLSAVPGESGWLMVLLPVIGMLMMFQGVIFGNCLILTDFIIF